MNSLRRAGILLPVFSLPSPYGIGAFGKAAFDFVDFLADAGQSLWQILPMGPVGDTGSPYQSLSAFAGNPYYIDLDLLVGDGLLKKRELKPIREATAESQRVDYAVQSELRMELLCKAAARFTASGGSGVGLGSGSGSRISSGVRAGSGNSSGSGAGKSAASSGGSVGYPDYETFRRDNAWWLDDFVSFVSGGEHTAVIQYIFYAQWMRLKKYANARGVGIVGDLPFYTGAESADYEAHPELFATDAGGRPRLIAGVPPDAFSGDGQVWNDPVYDWKEHERTGYDWWIRRFKQAAVMYDRCRIDHFRAFAAYFAIPAGRPAAEGRWVTGPGRKFIDAVKAAAPGLGVIAEDLGYITDDVHALRGYSGYPGMRVLQFAFEPGEDSAYLPHNHIRDCVCYTGTHDNPTLVEWASNLPAAEAAFARNYLGSGVKDLPRAVMRAALGSVAGTVIIPLQDYMGLGARARINTPSTVSRRNWTWKLVPGALNRGLAEEIRSMSRTYGRCTGGQMR